MGERTIQLLIEIFEVSAALSEALSRALCPLVCASGCGGCVRVVVMAG